MKRNLAIAMFVAALFATLNIGPIPPARASGSGGCSLASESGSYGFTYSGVAILPSGTSVPVAAVGRYTEDKAGNVVGSETNNLGGAAAFQTLIGTITLKNDCTATFVAQVYQGGVLARTSFIHLQYVNNDTEVFGIFQKLVLPDNSNLPVVITIDGKKVSHGE